MSEKQSYRDNDDMPTERAVLEREWKAMRLALSTPRAAHAAQPGSVGDMVLVPAHAQWLALGKASLLVAACNRLSGEAEEFDFDDGLGRGAPQAYWDEFEDALEQAAEAIDVANKTIHQDHIATPHTEAVRMSEAEINHLVDTHVGGPTPSYPLGPEDWINFARAVEQATAARLGVKMGDAP